MTTNAPRGGDEVSEQDWHYNAQCAEAQFEAERDDARAEVERLRKGMETEVREGTAERKAQWHRAEVAEERLGQALREVEHWRTRALAAEKRSGVWERDLEGMVEFVMLSRQSRGPRGLSVEDYRRWEALDARFVELRELIHGPLEQT